MDARRRSGLLLAGVLVLAGAGWALTAGMEGPEGAPLAPEGRSRRSPAPAERAPSAEGGVPAAAADAAPGAGAAAPEAISNDPELRTRVLTQARLARPHWLALAAKVRDPGLKAQAEAMAERLAAVAEPGAELMREQYELTQELITAGGYDPATQAALDYLNSTAAMVIQGGDPSEVITPEAAAARPGRTPR